MIIQKRRRNNLEENGIRVEKVEKEVREIVRMIQNDDFSIDESLLIAKMLSNDIEDAKYHSSDTKLSAVNFNKERKTYYISEEFFTN